MAITVINMGVVSVALGASMLVMMVYIVFYWDD